MKRSTCHLIAATLISTLVAACVIEDRTPGPELTDPGSADDDEPASSQACESYCSEAMENCTGEFQIYPSHEICETLCAHFPAGDSDNPEGNTVACRAEQARLAGTTGEPRVHCPSAGPGGNARGNNVGCGTDCEAYCYLHPRLCDIEGESPLEEEECLRQCAGLREKPTFSIDVDYDGEDSLECRLVHLTSAAAAPDAHCWHAAMAPRPESPCDDLPGAPVQCDVYCDLVMTACVDDHQMYENTEQCLATCEALPPGSAEDEIEDTVGCRRYHSYNALAAPAAHCLHAGPTGDGHCGTENCTSYCTILQAACESEFAVEFQDGADAGPLGGCVEACMRLDGANADESNYSVNPEAEGDTLGCRTLHAVRALNDANECAAAFGGAPCD